MKTLIVGLIVIVALTLSPTVKAHTLLTDTRGRAGAVLHVGSDDDPVAGEQSDLFYDIQRDSISSKTHSFTLAVTGPNGASAVPVSVSGSSAAASYVFTAQGVYTLTLTVTPLTGDSSQVLVFQHVQRVSRGIVLSPTSQPDTTWAEIVAIISGCGLLVVGIFAFNKRKEITAYTRQHSP